MTAAPPDPYARELDDAVKLAYRAAELAMTGPAQSQALSAASMALSRAIGMQILAGAGIRDAVDALDAIADYTADLAGYAPADTTQGTAA